MTPRPSRGQPRQRRHRRYRWPCSRPRPARHSHGRNDRHTSASRSQAVIQADRITAPHHQPGRGSFTAIPGPWWTPTRSFSSCEILLTKIDDCRAWLRRKGLREQEPCFLLPQFAEVRERGLVHRGVPTAPGRSGRGRRGGRTGLYADIQRRGQTPNRPHPPAGQAGTSRPGQGSAGRGQPTR